MVNYISLRQYSIHNNIPKTQSISCIHTVLIMVCWTSLAVLAIKEQAHSTCVASDVCAPMFSRCICIGTVFIDTHMYIQSIQNS